MSEESSFPPGFFARHDESDDADFYLAPRFVEHIDPATIDALTQVYREELPTGCDVLDLMSSWISHLPPEVHYRRVSGLGMNEEELKRNPRLDDACVQDLNRDVELPHEDASFDAVVNAVSIQYLVHPVDVIRSAGRVLRPGGVHLIALSHRCFPTKAIQAWHRLPPLDRVEVVREYFAASGAYEEASVIDRSPASADPLWIVKARRLASN